MFGERTNYTELNQMAEEAKRRAEIARYACMHVLMLNYDDLFCLHTFLNVACYSQICVFADNMHLSELLVLDEAYVK